MAWNDDEEESDFEWREEDEEEVPHNRGRALSWLRPLGAAILLGLVVLFIGSLLLRLAAGLLRLAE